MYLDRIVPLESATCQVPDRIECLLTKAPFSWTLCIVGWTTHGVKCPEKSALTVISLEVEWIQSLMVDPVHKEGIRIRVDRWSPIVFRIAATFRPSVSIALSKPSPLVMAACLPFVFQNASAAQLDFVVSRPTVGSELPWTVPLPHAHASPSNREEFSCTGVSRSRRAPCRGIGRMAVQSRSSSARFLPNSPPSSRDREPFVRSAADSRVSCPAHLFRPFV
jgi:hypothetical protein